VVYSYFSITGVGRIRCPADADIPDVGHRDRTPSHIRDNLKGTRPFIFSHFNYGSRGRSGCPQKYEKIKGRVPF